MNRKMQVAALLGATMLSTSVWAQETDEIIVLSSPFKKPVTEVVSTTEILTAEDLQAQIDGPLGNVLDALPGVSSAGYGPAVGQPVIRGLGGYRVDTMTNGMTIGDISSTSGDHTNVMSLFETERIEVLKGPAALRYGAYAATGVVNSFNRHLNADTEEGTDISFSFGDNADETITAFFTRQGQFSLSAISQDAGNITIPTHAETEAYHELHEEDGDDDEEHLTEGEQEAANTESESSGFTAAGHFGDDETNLSIMLSSHEMDYLVPHDHGHEEEGEDDDDGEEHHDEEGGADISLEQQTIHARLMHNGPIGPFNGFRGDLTSTTFEQTETVEEEDELHMSMFEQDSLHLRGEFTGAFNDWQTLVGLEFRDVELTAPHHEEEGEDDSEEEEEEHGYLPNTERSQYGLFAFAERERNGWLTELAVRFDSIEQDSFHEEADENASVSHDLTNISVGLAKKLDGNLLLGGSVSSTERAPSQTELFAEGVHHAVGRYEAGDPTLGKETALATELYLRRNWGNNSLRFAVFNNDYSDFIYMRHGECADVREEHTPGEDPCAGVDDHMQHIDYVSGDAELTGYELEYKTGFGLGGRLVDTTLTYSAVEGELASGGNLPTIPADKIGVSLATNIGPALVSLDIENVADQNDVALNDAGEEHDDELATDGYTSVDIAASWKPAVYEGLTLTATVRNLTDEEIRHHTSPLKDKLPEAGQDIRLTARYKF
jgi:iron complex outermembrane receptor protein